MVPVVLRLGVGHLVEMSRFEIGILKFDAQRPSRIVERAERDAVRVLPGPVALREVPVLDFVKRVDAVRKAG